MLGNLKATFGLAPSTVHELGGSLALWRCAVLDSVWLLPRQPVAYWLSFALPRGIEIVSPRLYSVLGPWFDADLTPVVLVATATALVLSDGVTKAVLWPEAGARRSTWRRLLTLVLCVVAPLVWAARLALFHESALHVAAAVERAFPASALAQSPWHAHAWALPEPFDLEAFVLNRHGGKRTLRPNRTAVFKQVDMSALESTCAADWTVALPGDTGFGANRADMERGVLRVDVYEPAPAARLRDSAAGAPVVLHIHGGGWKRGDRQFVQLNYHGGLPRMLLQRGVVIVSMAYRLSCSGVDPREMVADVRDGVRYVREHAHEWGADPDSIFPWGTSAGANLAMLAAYQQPLPGVRGVIAHYGPTEVRKEQLLAATASGFATLHSTLFVEATRHLCATHDMAHDDECFAALSPLAWVHEGAPPTLAIHGVQDPLVLFEQAEWLEQALAQHGVAHAVVKVVGSHDCDAHVSSPCSQATMYAVERFLAALVPRVAPPPTP